MGCFHRPRRYAARGPTMRRRYGVRRWRLAPDNVRRKEVQGRMWFRFPSTVPSGPSSGSPTRDRNRTHSDAQNGVLVENRPLGLCVAIDLESRRAVPRCGRAEAFSTPLQRRSQGRVVTLTVTDDDEDGFTLHLESPAGASWRAEGPNAWDALRALRRQVEPLGYRLCCTGARVNAYVSGMSISMSGGGLVYPLRRWRRPRTKDLVEIFSYAPEQGGHGRGAGPLLR